MLDKVKKVSLLEGLGFQKKKRTLRYPCAKPSIALRVGCGT